MHEQLREFFALLQRDRRLSPRSRKATFESSLRELRAELAELEAAHAKRDSAGVAAELGDVLWVVLFLMIVGAESGLGSAEQIIAGSIAKLRRRKPWLSDGDAPSEAEEARLWQEGKRKEQGRG